VLDTDIVLPSRDDPVIAAGCEGLGGPGGLHVRQRPKRVVSVLLVLTALVCALSLLAKEPCRANAWTGTNIYPDLCYSDIAFLYQLRGDFADNSSPYAGSGDNALEYPVLTGAFMSTAAYVTGLVDGEGDQVSRSRTFFDVTVLMLVACALATTFLLAKTAGRRPWDAALFALSPGLLLAAYINWDLFAVALTAGFGLAWARRRPVLAGALLGLAIAAKFYPLVLLGPLLLLCLRTGQLRVFGRTLAAAVVAWLVVNVPVIILWPHGWAQFYRLSQSRGAGFGSPWYALDRAGWGIPDGETLNLVSGGSFLLLCLGIAALALFAPRRPRLWQLGFLVVAAFAMTNKVYSPQYVLWMLAIFPLARPRWRDLLIWQGAEALYFVAIWWHLEGLTYPDKAVVPEWTHNGATFLRIAATLWVCGLIVRDIVRPECDPIRADGCDDPSGGVLDEAPDVLTWAGGGPSVADDDPVERGGRHAHVGVELGADGGHGDVVG
jgi:uncharacterized membrane protein